MKRKKKGYLYVIYNVADYTISHFTNFDTPDRYVLEDVNIDKKIVVFDFSHLYDIESEYYIEMNTLIKKLFNSLTKYFNFYFCIKLFRYEPNFEHLSCDRYWILRQMAESAIIKTIFKEKKREAKKPLSFKVYSI